MLLLKEASTLNLWNIDGTNLWGHHKSPKLKLDADILTTKQFQLNIIHSI